MKGPNLDRSDQKKIGAIVIGLTVGVPTLAILFSIIGLIELPITLSLLKFIATFSFIYSIFMVIFYIGAKNRVP